MKISIITVCKNEEKRIEKTLISVKNQSYKNIEHLLIDGLSTDKTTNIIQKYQPDYFISEADTGIYQAMNKGIIKSSGEMLLFLNSGDYLAADNIIELAINQLNSGTDIFFGRIFLLNPKTQLAKISEYLDISKEFFLFKTLQHPAALIKKSLFAEVGFYNEDFKIAADREFFAKAFMQNKAFQQSNIAISYFELGGISSIDKSNNLYENSIINRMYLDFYFAENANKYKKQLDLFCEKKATKLKELSEFYNEISADKKSDSLKFFQEYIIENINSIQFSWNFNSQILIYYLRYKPKAIINKLRYKLKLRTKIKAFLKMKNPKN